MKKHLLKSLLLIAALVMGAGSAWADQITATLDHTGSSSRDGSNAITTTVDVEKEHYNNTKAAAWGGWAYAQFSFAIPEGQGIKSATLTWSTSIGGTAGKNRDNSIYYLNAGTSIDWESLTATTNLNLTGNGTLITTKNLKAGSEGNPQTTDVTDAVKAVAASQTFIIFEWTNSASGADLWGKKSTQAPTLVIETVSADSQTTYTVKYTDGTNELKAAQTYNMIIGEQYTASAADMASFVIDGKKWIYASGNTTATSVADAASNVITLVFREAATWSYTVNAMNASSKIAEIANGSTFEGEEVKVPYHYYYNIDSTLYKKDALNKEYNYTFTLNSDNQVEELAYTASSINNVIFLSEAEDIATLTAVTGGGVGIRCSNSSGAFADEEALITTLTPGKYKLTGAGYGGNLVFKAGTVEILNMETVGYQRETPSEEFVIYTNTNITFIGGSNNNAALDYVFIQKTGDVTAEEIALAEAKAALQADIDAAKAIDTTGKKNAESLANAITEAETQLNAAEATVENLQAAQMALAKVVEAYEMANAKTIFLNPNIWDANDANERYAAYVWNDKGNKWFDFAAAEEEGVYTVAIPESYTGLILARMKGDAAENIWDNKWNQTADIDFTAVADSTLYTITGWGEGDNAKSTFEASKYVKAEPVLNTYTATFKTNAAWDKVYAYTWTGEGEGKVEQLGTWPGTEITETINDDNDDYDIYTATINTEAAPAYIIFNNGNENGVEGKTKTADLAFENGQQYELMITVSKLMEDAIALAADDEAVAVGKLLEAIDWAYDNDDESQLQAAIDQFKADNADQEKDETAKVATNGWKNFNGGNAGVCATQFAPAITTYDGRNAQLAEVYEEGTAEGTAVNRIGTIIYQDITGLTNGKYKVGFYGNAFFTPGRAGMTSDMEDGATDVAYVFANDQKEFITARIATSTTENDFRQFDVEVTDGTIKLGMGKEKPGTNWHTMQIYQLTWFTTAKEVFAADQEELKALIAEANTLLADETKTEGRDLFKGLVAAAEEYVDSKMINTTELESVIGNLKTAIAEFKQANYTTFNGKYYVQNVASGKFMAAGHDYGTRGIVDGTGLDMTLKANENKTVDFDSQVFQSDSKHFLGSNLYMDSDSWGWIIEKAGEDVYTISNGTQYIGVDAEDNLVLQDDAATWKFLGAEAVEAARLEAGMTALASATAENGVDATFLLKDANFNRNDHRWEAWTVSADCKNKNLGGGCSSTNGNGCAESWHSTFTIMQTIDGAPAGLYKMTAQGFYRQDEFEGDAPAAPQFFANDVNKAVPVRTGSENSMSEASASFTDGNYTIEPIDFVVTKEGDNAGKIYVGITNQNNTQWVIWDNFQLTYYGPAPATTYTVTVAETQNGTVEADKTEAAENETVSVTVTPADGYMVDEACWTYGEGDNVTKTNIEEPSEGNAATFIMPAANVTITVTFKAVAAEPVYYVVGTMNNWTPSDEYKMTLNKEAEGEEYMLTIDAEANAELKVIDNKGTWYPSDGGNYVITEAGEYDIYFRPNADGGDDWHYHVIYVAKKENAQPENIIYSWESPEGTPIQFGGTIAYVNGDGDRLNYAQGGYHTICLNGKMVNLDDKTPSANAGHMVITLENAVEAGDTIFYTAFLNKNESKTASPYFVFENGTTAEGEVFGDEANIDAKFNGVPTLKYTIVPEDAAGSKTITLTRGQTGTNLFITKLQIMQYDPTTGISIVKTAIENGAIYNLNGQKVNKAQKGLYIINGKKVVIK